LKKPACDITDEAHQEDVLYLTDPAGLRTILSGERGDVYDEFPLIVEYVRITGVIDCPLTSHGPRRNTLLRGPGLPSSNGSNLLSRGLSRTWLSLIQPSSDMAGRRQRQVLNKVFSAQRLRTVMPIFWDVTRRVCVRRDTAKAETD